MGPAAADFLRLLGGIAAFLILATLVGQWLGWRRPSDTVVNLNARIYAWWGIVLLLVAAFLAGRTGVVLLFAGISFLALREMLEVFGQTGGIEARVALFLILPAQYLLVWWDWYGLYAVFIPVYGFLLLPALALMRGDTSGILGRMAGLQWALMIAVYGASHVPALLYLEIPGHAGDAVP